MSDLKLDAVTKSFGPSEVIRPTDLAIEPGEFVVFVGPSGCGKTTLLRMIAGLEGASSGRIEIGGRDVTRLPPIERGVAMVFQSYALYPHMTVEENIGFGLRIAGVPKAERAQKVRRAADILQLAPLLARKPKALSGGQRQRVAIGRAIVKEPRIFLFDEPLSNLDAELRVQMRLEIASLHKSLGATMIYVTHDQVEAMTLADRIVVLRKGQVEQVGRPLELYENPANSFVAGFIGSPKMNFIDATVTAAADGAVEAASPAFGPADRRIRVRCRGPLPAAGAAIRLGVRPEHAAFTTGADAIPVSAGIVEHLGNVAYAYVRLVDGTPFTVEIRSGGVTRPDGGIAIDTGRVLAFGADGIRL